MLSEENSRLELFNRFKKYAQDGVLDFFRTPEYFKKIFGKVINLSGMNLRYMSFSGLSLSCVILDGCDLSFTNFTDACLNSCSMVGSDFTGSHLDKSYFDCCDFSESWFLGASIRECTIHNPRTYLTSFEQADLTGSKFVGNVDFHTTNFKDSKGSHIIQFCVNGECGYLFNGKMNLSSKMDIEMLKKSLQSLPVN